MWTLLGRFPRARESSLPHMSQEQPVYLSYLLRLWAMRTDGAPTCRASLEDALTGEHRSFKKLHDLFDFLRQQTGERADHARVRSDEASHGAP